MASGNFDENSTRVDRPPANVVVAADADVTRDVYESVADGRIKILEEGGRIDDEE